MNPQKIAIGYLAFLLFLAGGVGYLVGHAAGAKSGYSTGWDACMDSGRSAYGQMLDEDRRLKNVLRNAIRESR